MNSKKISQIWIRRYISYNNKTYNKVNLKVMQMLHGREERLWHISTVSSSCSLCLGLLWLYLSHWKHSEMSLSPFYKVEHQVAIPSHHRERLMSSCVTPELLPGWHETEQKPGVLARKDSGSVSEPSEGYWEEGTDLDARGLLNEDFIWGMQLPCLWSSSFILKGKKVPMYHRIG